MIIPYCNIHATNLTGVNLVFAEFVTKRDPDSLLFAFCEKTFQFLRIANNMIT